jgi:hypothetical protein
MADLILPRYPVYILSKDRYQYERAQTARALTRDGVPFILAVESTQVDEYRALCRQLEVDESCVHDIGFADLGLGCSSVRNWITDHARANGWERQWQLDDNSRGFYRLYRRERIPCRAGLALRICEDFTDRYENVGLSGLNYLMFGTNQTKPFTVNQHVYSCTLVNTAIDCRWRGPYNEDTDMCLQVLARGWCTILLNAFLVWKSQAFVGVNASQRNVAGGMSDLYQADGRLKMARSLERRWPGVVTTKRRYQRPQHVIAQQWRRFDTPLRRRPEVDLAALPAVDEYGMTLDGHSESAEMQRLIDEYPERD